MGVVQTPSVAVERSVKNYLPSPITESAVLEQPVLKQMATKKQHSVMVS